MAAQMGGVVTTGKQVHGQSRQVCESCHYRTSCGLLDQQRTLVQRGDGDPHRPVTDLEDGWNDLSWPSPPADTWAGYRMTRAAVAQRSR